MKFERQLSYRMIESKYFRPPVSLRCRILYAVVSQKSVGIGVEGGFSERRRVTTGNFSSNSIYPRITTVLAFPMTKILFQIRSKQK